MKPANESSDTRQHDRIYLREDRRQKPKEIFKFIAQDIRPYVDAKKSQTFLDIGCATGEFLFYLKQTFPSLQLSGIDVLPELIEQGKKYDIPASLSIGSVADAASLPHQEFDFVSLVGVHSIFDDPKEWFLNAYKLCRSGGHVYVFGVFNPSPVDVTIRYRLADGPYQAPDQRGWSVLSIKSIEHELKAVDCAYEFKEFRINLDVPPHTDDPMRAWTFKSESGDRLHTNGSSLLLQLFLLSINKR